MPNTRFHIGVADIVQKEVRISKLSDFYIGNIFPDAPWESFQNPMKQSMRSQLHLYRLIPGVIISVSDVHNWMISNSRKIAKSDFMKGQFLHLLLDANSNLMWNTRTRHLDFNYVSNKDMPDQYCSWQEFSQAKWKDVAAYSERRWQQIPSCTEGLFEEMFKNPPNEVTKYLLTYSDIERIIDDIKKSTTAIYNPSPEQYVPDVVNDAVVDLTINEFKTWLKIIS